MDNGSIRFDTLEDCALMERVRNGNTEAFGVLVRRYQQPLLNFFRRLGVYTDAEDLVQDCFLRVYRNRSSYRPAAKFSTFLYRVGRTVWIDWVRRKARREEFLVAYETGMALCTEQAHAHQPPIMDIQAALASLPDKLRLVVVMSMYQGLKYDEVAEALEIPVGTVKSRMSLAIERLRNYMYAEFKPHGIKR